MIRIDINKKLHGVEGEMNLEINLKIKDSEFIALTGESGSGKTTFLRVLAGLEKADGEIIVNDEVWQKDKIFLPPQKRKIGFVFQNYALFPNMSVEKNLLFIHNDKDLAKHLLEITNLTNLKDRLPNSLSGGQKQRVSLCRALMNRPKLLLMDEPLSALDPNLRGKLQNEILTLHKEFKITTIMVSHDLSEIYRLANRAILINLGKIIRDGTPQDVLLKTRGLNKFSFDGELLDIIKIDVIFIAIVAIGQQLVEIVVSKSEAQNLKIGDFVNVSTKSFTPIIRKILIKS